MPDVPDVWNTWETDAGRTLGKVGSLASVAEEDGGGSAISGTFGSSDEALCARSVYLG